MVFRPNDPKTQAAAKKGGNTGTKHFASAPKRKLKLISTKGGHARQEARRKKQLEADEANAAEYGHKVMHNYLS